MIENSKGMTELKLTPISDAELRHIADRVSVLRDWYNSYSQRPSCQFDGDPSDLSTLTFISYELGDDLWDWDAGETLSFVWGNVLVRRFDFQWVRLEEEQSPQHFAVRNLNVPYLVFPWTRLSEVITSGAHSHSAAEDLLVTILSELHSRNAIPEGWHPALDALHRKRCGIPEDIAGLIQILSESEPNWIRLLGLFPYQWDKSASWETVRMTFKSMIGVCGKHR